MSFTSEEARLLLHNKFVVVLGDSIQRAVYKDLVLFLQTAGYLTDKQLRTKCEQSFEGDCLLEGGELTNSTDYREARQFCQPFHLLRFHFLTRVYSDYVERVLDGFQSGPPPDILIINSCVWDISRYGPSSKQQYWDNLKRLFGRLQHVLPPSCLVIWSLAMPLGHSLKGGFLLPELQPQCQSLRIDVMEANFHGARLAADHGFDVLDLHFHFRLRLKQRAADGIHWDQLAHRTITHLLLRHIAEAWGVCVLGRRAPALEQSEFGARGPVLLGCSGSEETRFVSDLPESGPGYTSFSNASGPAAQMPWEFGARGPAPLGCSNPGETRFVSDLPKSGLGYMSFSNAPGPAAQMPWEFGARGPAPLGCSNPEETRFVSDLPKSGLGYMSFSNAPGPAALVPWEFGARGPVPPGRSSPEETRFVSDLTESIPGYMSFSNAPGPAGRLLISLGPCTAGPTLFSGAMYSQPRAVPWGRVQPALRCSLGPCTAGPALFPAPCTAGPALCVRVMARALFSVVLVCLQLFAHCAESVSGSD
ncbi:uncharacterized protein fam113 [Pristis pectinata]|uniref:uncharacterized protein fam113 n=1 Tax=Pristis pectinata TaxID=685728 RepID=UPI00223DC9AF|nr:uncharacterized protein fam113 [Pristis pectinata]